MCKPFMIDFNFEDSMNHKNGFNLHLNNCVLSPIWKKSEYITIYCISAMFFKIFNYKPSSKGGLNKNLKIRG